MSPFEIKLPIHQTSCVIFNSPHSGRNYPKEFLEMSSLPLTSLRSSEDVFVDEIISPIVNLGSILMAAIFPRCYVDLNRDHKELDPLLVRDLKNFSKTPKVSVGLGVIPRVVDMQRGIYSKKISKKEVKERIDTVYFPYHNKLGEMISHTHSLFQKVILLDCHSMPSIMEKNKSDKDSADIVLGDCYGASCENSILLLLRRLLSEQGFRVDINTPFSGGFITKNYSNPEKNYHAIQIEFLRSLYCNEKTFKHSPTFPDFQRRVVLVFQQFLSIVSNF